MRNDTAAVGAARGAVVILGLITPMLLLLVMAGCRDDGTGSGNNSLGDGDAGVCVKDRDALALLLAQPEACATSEICPTGSHCSETGQCDWQCISDSDCGSGLACTCDGRCIDEGEAGSDAGVGVDPSCPRNRDLLVDGTLQKLCTSDADCAADAHCNTTSGRCQLTTPPLQRSCILDEDCPFGSHCNTGTGRCAYDCLATNDPLLPCTAEMVCDCRGHCVAPNGVDACDTHPTPPTAPPDEKRVLMSVDRDVIAVPSAPWNSIPEQFTVTLRSKTQPSGPDVPLVVVRAPTGMLIDEAQTPEVLNWTQTLLVSTWSFQPEGDVYVARRTINVIGPTLMPTMLPGPWPIAITGDRVTGVPRSILVDVQPPTVKPREGIYEGTITARTASGPGLTTIPVTAWVNDDFVLFFDKSRALSSQGVLGIAVNGSATAIHWVRGDAGSEMTASIVSRVAPTHDPSKGELTDGRFAVRLPLHTSQPGYEPEVEFDYELRWTAANSAPTCSTESCGTGSYCEEELGRCVTGSEWRASTVANQLVSSRAEEWVAAASWFLQSNSPGLFGIPSIPGNSGIGRSLMCAPPLTSAATSGANVFRPSSIYGGPYLHPVAPSTVSGELYPWNPAINSAFGLCMQPVPLGIARDRATVGLPEWLKPPELRGDALLASCLDEATRAPPKTIGLSASDRTLRWFGTEAQRGIEAQCISLSRLYPFLEWNSGWNGPSLNRGPLEARGFHLVFSRWLAALSFIARQATEEMTRTKSIDEDILYPIKSDIDRSIAMLESAMSYLLRDRTSDALLTLPRDVLRHPDYRAPRPVLYYTFDPEDMNGNMALDVVGEAHGTISSTITRPTAACSGGNQECSDGLSGAISLTIPSGSPAELYGDFEIAFSARVPQQTWSFGFPQNLIRIGDSTQSAVELFFADSTGNNTGWRLYARHGAYDWLSLAGAVAVTNVLTTNTTYHFVVSRQAHYTLSSGGSATWSSEYAGYVNGALHSISTSAVPLITAPSGSFSGTINSYGYINDLAIWDSPIGVWAGYKTTRDHDNYHLDATWLHLKIPYHESYEQPVGMAAILMETTASHLSTTASATPAALGDSYMDCVSGSETSPRTLQVIERAGNALRYSWAAEAMAIRMHERAGKRGCRVNACPTGMTCGTDSSGEMVCMGTDPVPQLVLVPWTQRYQDALGEADAARASVVRALDPITNCKDPYGISPRAVPLFFGDPVGTSAKFFASSDYLMSTWAVPAVEKAKISLDQARDAWLNKRNSEIQQLQTEQQHQARLEQIELGYAQEIISLCGLTGVDPLNIIEKFAGDDPDDLSPDTCFKLTYAACDGPEAGASAGCFRGEMGKAALTIISASRAVDVAVRSREAAQQQYSNQSERCSQIQQNNATDANALAKHHQRMKALRDQQFNMSIVGGFCSGLVSMAAGNPGALVQAGLGAISADFDLRMRAAQDAYDASVHTAAARDEEQACFHEAKQLETRISVEAEVVRQRLVDVQIALLQLQNYHDRVVQILTEARSTLTREALRTVPSVAHHYWLDPKIDRYKRDFEWARRLTFLAARAVEYEFQQSIPAAADLLGAGSVEDLELAIAELQQEQAGRMINGRRPQQTSVVISLRDDVLRMFGQDKLSSTALNDGERTWSAERRLGKRLESTLFSMYDDEGHYLGQGIPFTLNSTGALRYRCAERLWRVNATVQGDIPGMSTPSVPIMLLKRNTFSSQWCDGRGDGTPMQQGTVFSSTNLFKLQGGSTNGNDADASTAALLMPWFNVIRSEFYKEQYVDGSSEEFAGRGLYGDYVLLFPESGLLEWKDGNSCNDFPLSRVEDVLLRFDLISVDDLQL
jgi:hypothetical protein